MAASTSSEIEDKLQQQQGGQENTQQQQQPSTASLSLVDSLVSGESSEGVGGILCTDPNGLCLAAKGTMANENADLDAGIYASLVRLASQLQQSQQQPQQQQSSTTASDGAGGGENNNTTATAAAKPAAPLITIEGESSAVLIKEYDGHTVALRVPTTKTAGVSSQLSSSGASKPSTSSTTGTTAGNSSGEQQGEETTPASPSNTNDVAESSP